MEPRPTPAAPPTDRVLEQVSPVDKGGQPIDHVLQVAAGDDGDSGGVIFQSLGAFGDVQNNNGPTFYRARRGATGWETTGLQPRPIDGIPSAATTPDFIAADAGLDGLIATSGYPFVPEAVRPGNQVANIYRYGADGAVSWLSGEALAPGGAVGYAQVGAVSTDGRRVLLKGLAEGSNAARLYVRDDVRTVEVGFGPGDVPLAGALPAGDTNAAMRAPTAMSDDGQTVAFQPTSAGGTPQSELYLRRDALRPSATTVIVNRSRRSGDPAGTTCGTGERFFGMTADGSEILLACGTPLTDDAPATGPGVYRYDVGTDELEYQGEIPGVLTEIGTAPDLARFYFVVTNAGQQDLMVFEGGQQREIATDIGSGVNLGNGTVAMSPDGRRLAFASDSGIGGYGGRQMYLYDVTRGAQGTLTCVSCRPGASSGGTASFGTQDIDSPGRATNTRASSYSADGRFYFMSTAALTPEAPEGPASVYEFHDGSVRLMVAGADGADARFVGVSPEGTDVFVITRQSLLPQDDDAPVPDLYTLRRGGGFPPPPVCAGCVPPPPPDLGGPRPGSVPGSLLPVPVTRGTALPPAAVTPRIVGRTARGTTVRIRVRVASAGNLRVTGNGLQRLNRRVARGGTFTLAVRLTTNARRTLDRRGRITVRPQVRFAPQQGTASRARTTLTIKRTRKAS